MKTIRIIKDKELIRSIKSLAKTLGIRCTGVKPEALQVKIEQNLGNILN
jgi:hypothetical protein